MMVRYDVPSVTSFRVSRRCGVSAEVSHSSVTFLCGPVPSGLSRRTAIVRQLHAFFTGTLTAAGVRISMDGRGRWMDNVFIERLWRSLKYEDVYLKGYSDGREARAGIGEWVAFYTSRRPHHRTRWRSGAMASPAPSVPRLWT
jgi:transposase InsO family protein